MSLPLPRLVLTTDLNKNTQVKNFSQFPFAWLAICFGVGVWITNFLAISIYFWLVTLITAATAALCLLVVRREKQAVVFLLAAFLASGALLHQIEKQSVAPNRVSRLYDSGQFDFKTRVELVGTLRQEPEQTPGGYFLTLQTETLQFNNSERSAAGEVRLFLPVDAVQKPDYENLNLRYGAKIKVATRLTRESRFRNPGGLDYRAVLAQKNLDASGTIKEVSDVQKLADAKTFAPLGWLYAWRAKLVQKFNERFSIASAGVLAASLLNNRYYLDKQTAEKFREGGTFHVLVISGVHITFIGFLMAWLTRKITRNLTAQFVAANALLWLYTLAVGAEISVTRAAIMFTLLHAAALFGRENTALNSLGAAALLLLVWRPADLFDPSFQLTFLSVTAIVAVAFPVLTKMREIGAWRPSENTPAPPVCAKWLKTFCEILFWSERNWQQAQKRSVWKAKLFKSDFAKQAEEWHLQIFFQLIFSAVFVSILVTAFLLPLMVVYFHRVSFAALFLNIFVGALIALVSFAGIIAVFIAEISPVLAQPFVAWTELFNFLLINSSTPFINTDFASVRLPVYTGAASVIYSLYYLPLIGLSVFVHRWNPFEQSTVSSQQLSKSRRCFYLMITVHCSLLTVILFHPLSAASTGGRLRIDFLDVGQGDAALITTPNGTTILVDGGGRPSFGTKLMQPNGETQIFVPDTNSVGETVVSEFLWEKGLSRIDFIVPTHADFDHIDGLNDVAENFSVQTAFVGRTPANDAEFKHFAEILKKRGVPMVKISRGEVLEIDGIKLEVLHPVFDADPKAVWDNNNSLVFRLIYGSRSFLLTGDIEAKTEKLLSEKPETLVADVVKVAHHGSKTSSTEDFVSATQAKFAVISVGRESQFGHPHPQPLERWQRAKAQILITGEKGTITFNTDGTDLRLETFVK